MTSRVMLPDLLGARPVELDVLPEREAARLLDGIVGAARTRAEPECAAAILRFCGYLPLAIRVVGTRLTHRRGWTLRTMADRLRDERHRLDELRMGDLAVRASVNLSYDLLTPAAALAFRRLGLLGPVRWPGWVVGALLGRESADDVLDALVDAHLVELVGPDETGAPRYRLHDLLRCYAAELASTDAGARGAVARVLAEYVERASAAAAGMPYFGVLPAWSGAAMADPVAWFDAERHTGVAVVALAESYGLTDLAWRLATAFAPYFDLRGRQDDWQRTHDVALAAARRAGDAQGEAIVLRNLGQVALYRDGYADARVAFEESHRLFERVGDDRGVGDRAGRARHGAADRRRARPGAGLLPPRAGVVRAGRGPARRGGRAARGRVGVARARVPRAGRPLVHRRVRAVRRHRRPAPRGPRVETDGRAAPAPG